jgi:hypothetical protein
MRHIDEVGTSSSVRAVQYSQVMKKWRFLSKPDDGAMIRAEQRAWEIYRSHAEWIARVDIKASILLALQGIALGAVFTMTAADRPFASLHEWWDITTFIVGVALLLAGLVLAVLVIAPRVRTKKPSKRALHDFIYFGHTRWWKADDLERTLHDSALTVLSRQLIILGEIAWQKHLFAMWATWLFLASVVALSALALYLSLWG